MIKAGMFHSLLERDLSTSNRTKIRANRLVLNESSLVRLVIGSGEYVTIGLAVASKSLQIAKKVQIKRLTSAKADHMR